MLWGYVAAILVAAAATHLLIALITISGPVTNGESLDLLLFQPKAIIFLGFVAATIAAVAFPAWLIAAIIAELRWRREKRWFVNSGIVAAALVSIPGMILWLSAEFHDGNFSGGEGLGLFLFWIVTLLIGALGGLTYWSVAGRYSGAWKDIGMSTTSPVTKARA